MRKLGLTERFNTSSLPGWAGVLCWGRRVAVREIYSQKCFLIAGPDSGGRVESWNTPVGACSEVFGGDALA